MLETSAGGMARRPGRACTTHAARTEPRASEHHAQIFSGDEIFVGERVSDAVAAHARAVCAVATFDSERGETEGRGGGCESCIAV